MPTIIDSNMDLILNNFTALCGGIRCTRNQSEKVIEAALKVIPDNEASSGEVLLALLAVVGRFGLSWKEEEEGKIQ
eukprot:1366789-Amorphochlora_amoeboformis.AAC.1